jgi:hypothetical protein
MKPINPLKIVEDFWTAVWKAQNPLSIDQFVVDEFVLTQSQDGSRVASRWRVSGKNNGLLGTRSGSKADFVNFEEIVGHSAALNVAASQGDTICRIPQTPKAISRF